VSILGNVARRIFTPERRDPEHFLKYVPGVIHVGANTGQERVVYDNFGLRVIWIEPIPSVFDTLAANIRPFPRQRAFQGLVTNRNDAEYEFHIANNDGKSSSILAIKQHADIWPDVQYRESIRLKSTTLTALCEREKIDPADYGALVMDTQGSELLVLQGAVGLLRGIEYIKTEVADFEAYAGCCRLADIEAFMRRHGYAEIWRKKFAGRAQGGSYYDVTYRKKPLQRMLSGAIRRR
jgi:FkbM family methyltransferase